MYLHGSYTNKGLPGLRVGAEWDSLEGWMSGGKSASLSQRRPSRGMAHGPDPSGSVNSASKLGK